jgi:hypothetical protein
MNDNNQPPNHPPGDENTNGEKQPTGGSPQKPALTPAQIHEIDRAEDREFNEDRFRRIEKLLEKAQATTAAQAKRLGDLERQKDTFRVMPPQATTLPASAPAPVQATARSEPWWIPALWILALILFVLLFCHFALGSNDKKDESPKNPFTTSAVVPSDPDSPTGGAS